MSNVVPLDERRRRLREERNVAALELEQAAIGAVLSQPDSLERVRLVLTPEDFAEPLHEHIWRALCERSDAGDPLTMAVVRAAVGRSDVGGVTTAEYTSRLFRAGTGIEPMQAARLVRRARQIRIAEEAAADLAGGLAEASIVEDPTPRVSQVIETLDAIVSENASSHLRRVSLAEAAREVPTRVQEKRAGRIAPGVSFGIPGLDQITGGMHPGQLIVAAARPAMGKTSVALHIAQSAAAKGAGVLICSLEMGAQELTERIVSAFCRSAGTRVPYKDIATARHLSDQQIQTIDDASRQAQRLPIEIDPQPGLTISQIAARARHVAAKGARSKAPLRVLIVDHIGLIKPSARYQGNRVQEISEITGALKTLARELGITVVALSQLNRGVENRPIGERRPQLSDLRDSGSIEQDADVVLGLFREAYYLANVPKPDPEQVERLLEVENELEIEVLKQRQGPTRRIRCFCDIACNVIGELAR